MKYMLWVMLALPFTVGLFRQTPVRSQAAQKGTAPLVTSRRLSVCLAGVDVVLIAAKVEQGGKFKASDLVRLQAASIAVNGKPHQVVTSLSETKTGGEGKKTAGEVVGGALILELLSEESLGVAKALGSAH